MKAKVQPNSPGSAASGSGQTEKSDTIKEITIYDSEDEVVEIDKEIKVTKTKEPHIVKNSEKAKERHIISSNERAKEPRVASNNEKAKEKEKEKPKEKIKPDSIIKKHYLNNSLLRGLLPRESEESYQTILNYPVVKRCCIEHCYFARSRSGTFRYNLRSCSANDANTLPFENANEHEQETIDFECLGSKDIISTPTNNSLNGNIKVYSKKKRSSISSCSGSSGVTEGSVPDDSNDRECPVKGSTGTVSENLRAESVESGDSSVRIFSGSGTSLSKPILKILKNVPPDDRKKNASRHRLEIKSYPITNKTPNNFVSVHDLITKFQTMQKLMRAKCERRLGGDSGKAGKLQPIRVKKLSMARGKGEDLPQLPECIYPVPNLTKMADGGDKNWRVEYMDDDVQNFGLDDLLLKASELNAENFTKALGRKMDSMNSADFNPKDSSEIVFTIPKSKRNSVDEKQTCEKAEGEFSTNLNLKSIKLDISKPFFESGEVKEKETSQEVAKPPEEASPKRPGIKVKTVENINEEFKDSLNLKKLLHEESSNESGSKELTPLSENRRILPSSSFGKRMLLDKIEQEGGGRREGIENKKAEESRPFIMTIIQSKSEKQRPAILRNSSYFKKKVNNAENARSLEKNDEGAKNSERQQTEPNLTNLVGSGKGGEDSAKTVPESQDLSLKALENTNFNLNKNDSFAQSSSHKRNLENSSYGNSVESEDDVKRAMEVANNDRFALKKRNIPFILNHNKKHRMQETSSQGNALNNTQVITVSPSNKLVKVNEGTEKLLGGEKTFKVTSIEQKLGPKEMHRRFIKVVPYEPIKQLGKKIETGGKVGGSNSNNVNNSSNNSISEPPLKQQIPNEDVDQFTSVEGKNGHVLSLGAFASILKDILSDKWSLFYDKKYGLQIVKTHVDEMLNPSLLVSVVIARCGKVTVNVRGRQLQKSHELFSNLCEIGNSENKLSLNYVLALLNRLNLLSVCYGCDDQSLRKYWCKDGFVEYQTEFQQVYRSHLCHMLVSIGRRRCYPCCRMTEALRKRYRREKLGEKSKDTPKDLNSKMVPEVEVLENSSKVNLHPRGVKRNLEDFLEESFSTMKKQIADELEKNKKLGERENAMKAQEEVLSFMGLTRKDSLDNPVRKSKRKKTSFYSQQQQPQQPVKKKIDQQELEFLEKYWPDIYTLFSTSLLFGAYSRTGRSRLRENCRLFQKLLSTWRNIGRTDPEWIGGEITLPEHLFGDPLADNSGSDQFEKMEVPALRNYIINSVKEVNRIKHKLRTRNSYFKILYNKFVKRRMKRSKSESPSSDKKTTPGSSNNSATNTPTPTDLSSDESSRDKGKMTDDENRPATDSAKACVSLEGD